MSKEYEHFLSIYDNEKSKKIDKNTFKTGMFNTVVFLEEFTNYINNNINITSLNLENENVIIYATKNKILNSNMLLNVKVKLNEKLFGFNIKFHSSNKTVVIHETIYNYNNENDFYRISNLALENLNLKKLFRNLIIISYEYLFKVSEKRIELLLNDYKVQLNDKLLPTLDLIDYIDYKTNKKVFI